MKKPEILAIGSMNMDLIMYDAPKLPVYGESISCSSYEYTAGGKGANQAVAAAKQGANVTMVGRVGDDENGRALIENLKDQGVDTSFVVVDEYEQTCLAPVIIAGDGRYVSYNVMGANSNLSYKDVENALNAKNYDMVVMQLEMPLETVYKTCELAKKRGVPIFFDAGPATDIDLAPLSDVFIISPNEVETKVLTGIDVDTDEKAVQAAKVLFDKSAAQNIILKLGGRGALHYNGENYKFFDAHKNIAVVDTTAAGDTFGAACAVQICKGNTISDSIRFANAAGALCVSQKGAISSVPTEQQVISFLSKGE